MTCIFCGGKTHSEDVYLCPTGKLSYKVTAWDDRCEKCGALTYNDKHNTGKIIQIKAPRLPRARTL